LFGKVPLLVDGDGFRVMESHAIMKYLVEGKASSSISRRQQWWGWYPSTHPRKAAVVDALLDVHHTHVRSGAAPVTFRVMGQLGGLSIDPRRAEVAEPTLSKALGHLDAILESAERAAEDVVDGISTGGEQDQSKVLHPQCKGFGTGAFVAAGLGNICLPEQLDGTPGGHPPIVLAPWIIELCGGPSIADLSIACELEQMLVLPDVVERLAPFPRVVRWQQRVRDGFNAWKPAAIDNPASGATEPIWDSTSRLLYKVVGKQHSRPVHALIDDLNRQANPTS